MPPTVRMNDSTNNSILSISSTLWYQVVQPSTATVALQGRVGQCERTEVTGQMESPGPGQSDQKAMSRNVCVCECVCVCGGRQTLIILRER